MILGQNFSAFTYLVYEIENTTQNQKWKHIKVVGSDMWFNSLWNYKQRKNS
jgi:hypothetical protein